MIPLASRVCFPRHRMFLGRTRMSLTQRAIDEIKAMIIRGELAAGDRLPKEADLAARLGLSRNSLREAGRAPTLPPGPQARQGGGADGTRPPAGLVLGPLSLLGRLPPGRPPPP